MLTYDRNSCASGYAYDSYEMIALLQQEKLLPRLNKVLTPQVMHFVSFFCVHSIICRSRPVMGEIRFSRSTPMERFPLTMRISTDFLSLLIAYFPAD